MMLNKKFSVVFSAALLVCSQSFAQQKTEVEIVPNLRSTDRASGVEFKGVAGSGGVVKSTVEIADDGTETVIYDRMDAQNRKKSDNGDRMDALSKGKKDAAPVVAVEAKPVKSQPAEFKAASPKPVQAQVDSGSAMLQDPFAAAKKKPEGAGVVKAERPKQVMMDKAEDKFVPEAGVKVNERTTTERTIEKMVPPSDELIYGALKSQGMADKFAAPKNTGGSDKPIVIDAIQGVNEIVTIGKGDLNRFVTPFQKVVVRTSAGEDELVSKVDGNVVYIGATKRAGVFLVEGGTGRAISLTVVPDDVPPRDIYVTMARSSTIPASLQNPGGSKEDDSARLKGKSNSHVEYVKTGMREIAQGKLPNGYTLMRPKATDYRCQMPNLKLRLGQILEGSGNKFLVYRADNDTAHEVVVDEQYCYKRGVIAVSAWPDVAVPPGGSTEVFVLMNMASEEPELGGRPSLIGRE